MFRRIDTHSLAVIVAAHRGMVLAGLPAAKDRFFQDRCPKFFFTEEGWKKFGHRVLSEIRAAGLQARIITVKERRRDQQVVYRDRWQVCLAFRKKCSRPCCQQLRWWGSVNLELRKEKHERF